MNSTIDLRGLSIMVTRPAHQAEPLCQLIEASGGRPYRFPVLEIRPPDRPVRELQEQLERLDRFQMAIFISPNAVTKAIELIRTQLMDIPPRLKLATIGKSSSAVLQRLLGRKPDICASPPFNSEALLTNSGMQNLSGQNIIIFRGNGGRELLAETLRSRGARVEYCEVYRRACPAVDPDTLSLARRQGRIDVITITSGEGLHNLIRLAGAANRHWLLQTPLAVINPRLATLARELGFEQDLLVSREANDRAIVAAIGGWATRLTTS